MMIKRLPFQLFAVGIVASMTVGCSQDDGVRTPGKGSTASTANTKNLSLAFVTNGTDPFWTIAKRGVEKFESEDPTVKVDFREPPTGTAAEQKAILDDLVVKGVQGLAISVRNPKDQVDMINDVAKKALVFTQDSDAPDTNRTCYVGTDNVAAGKQVGEEIKKACPGGGKIMCFVGDKTAGNAIGRYQGIVDDLKGSNIQIVDIRTDTGDRERAKANAADAVVANPDLVCLVGLWSYNGPAIYNAMKDANKLGKIKIVCFDEDAQTLAGVKEGSISATVVQQPFEFGYQCAKLMSGYLRGAKFEIPRSKQIYVPTQVIDKSNVDAFWDKLKALTAVKA
jgi:ribose transport system substrate-binding protein